ncbi:MAG: VWA-like domain-containing protein [Myxococcota bacterium]
MSELDARLRRIRWRLRSLSPFFASLSLFLEVRVGERVPTFATDGSTLFLNPRFAADRDDADLMGVVLHVLLHAALLHPVRRGDRTPLRWNVAADHVVTNLMAEQGFAAHPGGLRPERRFRGMRVEEVYSLLPEDVELPPGLRDLVEPNLGPGATTAVETRWRDAIGQASQAHTGGRTSALVERMFEQARPSIAWGHRLWAFVSRSAVDFEGFDRRFVHRGLYLDRLDAESIRLCVAVDTSGSIAAPLLARFLAELEAIAAHYPHLRGELFYVDAALDGPHPLASGRRPVPRGGGGTSFVPFFDWSSEHLSSVEPAVCVYFTDGQGRFPRRPPSASVLWVVPAGGLASDRFPFGEVVRMVEE